VLIVALPDGILVRLATQLEQNPTIIIASFSMLSGYYLYPASVIARLVTAVDLSPATTYRPLDHKCRVVVDACFFRNGRDIV